MAGWVWGRKLFVTERGYFGLGAPYVEPGDIVCIFNNGYTPYVLRPQDKGQQFLLVGNCYVHGLMNGEGVNEAETVDIELI